MEDSGFGNGDGDGKASSNGGIRRTLEEEIYWTNFKSMRFFQFLSGDFLSQLMIPKKFSENLREKLPQMVVLKGPGGATRDIQIERSKDATLSFKDGWKEFAKAHSFKENDLLMFKYNRDSSFKVRVFDGKNLCESVGSYFVRDFTSRENAEGGSSQQGKRKTRESPVDVLDNEDESDYEGSGSEWAPIAGTWKKKGRRDYCGGGSRRRDVEMRAPSMLRAPNGGTPCAEEKERAFQMAMRELTADSFMVVIKPAHVTPFHRLCIPAPWARNHLIQKNQDLELRVKDKSWTTRLNIHLRNGAAVIISGWFSFARDNSLQEFDVCLFKLSSNVSQLPAVFDVQIFRAASDVTDSNAVQQTPARKLSPA